LIQLNGFAAVEVFAESFQLAGCGGGKGIGFVFFAGHMGPQGDRLASLKVAVITDWVDVLVMAAASASVGAAIELTLPKVAEAAEAALLPLQADNSRLKAITSGLP
jgi:hypothetical protein